MQEGYNIGNAIDNAVPELALLIIALVCVVLYLIIQSNKSKNRIKKNNNPNMGKSQHGRWSDFKNKLNEAIGFLRIFWSEFSKFRYIISFSVSGLPFILSRPGIIAWLKKYFDISISQEFETPITLILGIVIFGLFWIIIKILILLIKGNRKIKPLPVGIELSFGKSDRYRPRDKFEITPGHGPVKSVCFRIKAQSNSYFRLRDCKVKIIKIEFRGDPSAYFTPHELKGDIELGWARSGGINIDLGLGDWRYFDVICSTEVWGSPRIISAKGVVADGLANIFAEPGEYRIVLEVRSRNRPAMTREFMVSKGERWDDVVPRLLD